MPDPLDVRRVVIRSPCTVPWDSMRGDDVKRFCGECRLHVHDVSRMTRREADALLRTTGGDCCLRIWRRPDGRVITKDCGRVRRALRRRVTAIATATAAVLAMLGLGGCRHRANPAPGAAALPAPGAQPWMGTPADPTVPGATVTTGK